MEGVRVAGSMVQVMLDPIWRGERGVGGGGEEWGGGGKGEGKQQMKRKKYGDLLPDSGGIFLLEVVCRTEVANCHLD